MKKIISILAAIIMVAIASAQTKPLATLSHNGELTFFDQVSALEDAIEASVDGDIIYLSDGKFGASRQSLTITSKKISIIGNGYNSHILPDIIFDFKSAVSDTLTAPLLDGVRLEELSFRNSINSKPVNQVEIKKCKIDKISLSYTNNVRLDRCNINTFNGTSNLNVQVYNSKIGRFEGTKCEIVENCNIDNIHNYSPSYITNSIINRFTNTPSGGIYENCLIGNNAELSTSNDLRNCYDMTDTENTAVLDENLECTIENMDPYTGIDGTVVGIYGGQWFPFSETPSVPTVDATKSSVVYDKENNKLNVTITVAPN